MSWFCVRFRLWRLKRLIRWYLQQIERHQAPEELLHVTHPELRAARTRISLGIEALARAERSLR